MRNRPLWSLVLALLVACPLAAAQPSTVTFVIDMREEIAAKRFDPAEDKVGVRGGVIPLAWNQTLPARDEDGDGRYEVRVSFPERPFGGQPVNYKYKVDSPKNPDGGWEEGTNRQVALQNAAQTVARRYNEPPPPIRPVLTGTIRTHPAFASQFLGPRDVVVYLPPGYDREPSRRFPVLYMHDGQNIFDGSHMGMEWQMDEIAERLIAAGQIEPVIIVGVFNTEARGDEYTPTAVDRKQPDGTVTRRGGKADLYGRLLIEELKPFIDRTYRTRPDARSTGLGGASHGGLVSLYLGLKHPDVFGNLLVVSASSWWDDFVVLKTLAALPAKTGQRIWVDMGDHEGEEALATARRVRDALVAKGWKLGDDLRYLEPENGQHDEVSWAARVEPMLRFLYGKV
jgi:predicted alpha/beta superfamily hydrolase